MITADYLKEINALKENIVLIKSELEELKTKPDQDLWDNSDMMSNWAISKRTLCYWRAKGLIDYIQVEGKVWYAKEHRDDFIKRNSVRAE